MLEEKITIKAWSIIISLSLLMCSIFLYAQHKKEQRWKYPELVKDTSNVYLISRTEEPYSKSVFNQVDTFLPILNHSKIPKVKKQRVYYGIAGIIPNTVWDFHRDSIFNIEWYAYEDENFGTIKIWRSGPYDYSYQEGGTKGYYIVKLVHTFKAPHIHQYYKHIKDSEWICIREQYDIEGHILATTFENYTSTFLFYKQYSSYTIHTL